MSESEEAIKQSVLEYYGQKARSQLQNVKARLVELPVLERSSCCSEARDLSGKDASDAAALAEVPQDISEFSLGCGNPVGIASIQPGEVVLDLGSGGGLDCFLAARATGPQGRVLGVDMNPDMLRLARNNAPRLGATNVEFRLGELEHLPVETGTIDLVISNCVINLVPDKDAVFREAFRVLRPGGRLCVADMVTETALPEALRADPERWCGCIAGAIPQKEYLEKLRGVGFREVQVLQITASEEGDIAGTQLLSATITATKA